MSSEATCRGSYLLRTACDKCSRCAEEKARMGVNFDRIIASQVNLDKLRQCQMHRFSAGFSSKTLGKCDRCGGEMKLTDVGHYINGYEAAGGKANDIWPNWRGWKRP